ncbi:hypothetical protein AB4571_01775 [Vibrio breoganii]|nr:hypothetical protein [Vibrio breoganii]
MTNKGNYRKGEIELLCQLPVFDNENMTIFNDKVSYKNGRIGFEVRTTRKKHIELSIITKTEDGRLLLVREYLHQLRDWTWKIPTVNTLKTKTPQTEARLFIEEATQHKVNSIKNLFLMPELVPNEEWLIATTTDKPTLIKTALQQFSIQKAIAFTPEQVQLLIATGEIKHSHSLLVALSFTKLEGV